MASGHILKVIDKQGIDNCSTNRANCRDSLGSGLLSNLNTKTLRNISDKFD